MARARKARLPELIRTPKDMVDAYELSLKLSGKVRPDPQQLAKQKSHYSPAAEVIQPPRNVIEEIRKMAPGSHKTYLLNFWRRAKVLLAKGLNIDDIVAGLEEMITKNRIPRDWAEKVLSLAGYDKNLIAEVLNRIYGAGGAVAGAGGAPKGL
ncbi:MAG: hypothetical protein JHC33_08095 [Ignisphaera sp.]|nr:hypothetical protein [Ignisphaera sp.]